MKKLRFISLLLVLALLLPCAVFGAGGEMPFKDVKEGKWYYNCVKFVYERDLMQGVAKDRFDPNGSLTRAMFVTILCRIHGGEKKNTDDFTDVKPGKWYSGYVGWAASTGVVNGYSDGTFRPDANITRQEIATAMVRYIEFSGNRLPRRSTAPAVFADSDKVAKWAKDYVETLRRAGVVNGDKAGNFNPKANVTRAEVAQMIKNLIETEALAWQGYLPDPGTDGFAVYGAKYLYTAGFAIQEKLKFTLDESGEYPDVLVRNENPNTDPDAFDLSQYYSYEPLGTVGFSPTAVVADLTETPVVKICYSLDGGGIPDSYISNRTTGDWFYFTSPLVFEAGEDDGGYATATCDVTDALPELGEVAFGTDSGSNIHIMFTPFAEDAPASAAFRIRYVGLFASKAAADAFNSADLEDYLKNYSLYSDAEIKTAGSDVVDAYIAEVGERIKEIKNSPSDLTPADIKAAGGTCYYISSLNGDDGNDGLSPETAWATPAKLWKYIAPIRDYASTIKKGDGVFFERGSEFYPWRFYNDNICTLPVSEGVSYGAYGDPSKPKPAFYGSFDFGGGTGNWQATEWENVYVLDLRDYLTVDLFDYLPEEEREAKRDHFLGEAGDIGNIIFNEGQFMGVRVFPDDLEDPFGEDKTTRAKLKQGNCDEYFISGGTTCKDPGDALRHNLEFIHDWKEGKVYLRCEWGDPSEYFDRIDLCRHCNISYASGCRRLDNLRFLYSGYIGVDLGEGGMDVTWCEAGYAGGSHTSVGTGIGGYGKCNYMRVDHCYIHDVEDGPMGTQFAGDDDSVVIRNVILTDNVITTAKDLVELFSTNRVMGEDGLGKNKIIDCEVRGNYCLYLGYGYARVTEGEGDGLAVHNWYYGEMVDCVCAENTLICCEGSILGAHIASDNNPRGWKMYSNTYVLDPSICSFLRGTDGVTYTNLKKSFYASYDMGFTDRTIKYLTSIGIDTDSTFLSCDVLSEAERAGYFITNGYYIERGIRPR